MATVVDVAVGECESCLTVAALRMVMLGSEVFVVCEKCDPGVDTTPGGLPQ